MINWRDIMRTQVGRPRGNLHRLWGGALASVVPVARGFDKPPFPSQLHSWDGSAPILQAGRLRHGGLRFSIKLVLWSTLL